MKKLLFLALISLVFWSCGEQEPDKYTGQKLEFELFKSSDFDYTGNLIVQELTSGALEFTIQLEGARSEGAYTFPAHLHFGGYEQADAPIAFLLSPVSSESLKSVTEIGQLSDGSVPTFEQMKVFDGHVKIHLANEGPDYNVILVAGNIGTNAELGFDPEKIAICGKSY
ncbi:hypothetical protein [Algoriphagus sp. CAU 1675]|uniref:hypothetical protein n=1 Tax=Algoriphagus sp. CAU 1675 TaxID=3032597 RepID=UPI0023DCC994|nr:hypothetical protein [Algoriphagus sp. CAU 1675]MDF2158084.1 hypothetical protein [Algoriphagus sp. CAU 1675]